MTDQKKLLSNAAAEMVGVEHMDANETANMNRALEAVKAKSFDVLHIPFRTRTELPVASDVDPSAESIVYPSFDMVGEAAVVSNYADDLPLADAIQTEATRRVVTLGMSYQYTKQDLRRAARGMNLPARKAEAARRGIEQKLEKVIVSGSAPHNIPALSAYPGVPIVSTALPAWASATSAQVLADIAALTNAIVSTSGGIHRPNKMFVPEATYQTLKFLMIANTNQSILSWLMDPVNMMGIQVVPWNTFATAGASSATRVMLGQFTDDICRVEITQEIEVEAGQPKNLSVIFPMTLRTAGFVVNYPLAFAYMDAR